MIIVVGNIGKNMLYLRVSNRVAVLNMLYSTGGMSRKEIAARLSLTPAAISHITSDMIAEGVLVETKKVEGSSRMGRREIILEIDLTKFKVMCAYIPTRDVRITCIDLAGNVDFCKNLQFDTKISGEKMIDSICDEMLVYMDSLSEEQRRWIIGAGLGVKGICDDQRGISVNSFGLWEDNLPIRELVEKRLGLKVMTHNNIRCVASGEMLFNQHKDIQSMLFVKLGPLVGGAFVLDGGLFKGYGNHAMELGHFVVDPLGSVCRCGKRGCLETVIGFDVIADNLGLHYSATRVPILYQLTGGDKSKITMENIMESFDRNERVVCEILDGALERFAFMLVDAIGLIDPQIITLYGFPFESEKFMELLKKKITKLNHGEVSTEIVRSSRNLQLDDLGCASIVIKDFLSNGAIYTPIGQEREDDIFREETI
ncbi:MAG: ROK family protein [Acetanaerobacterium sp.]